MLKWIKRFILWRASEKVGRRIGSRRMGKLSMFLMAMNAIRNRRRRTV